MCLNDNPNSAALCDEYEHRAKSAKIAYKVLKIGVPGSLVLEAVDLNRSDIVRLCAELGDLAPIPIKGALPSNPVTFITESFKRTIACSVVVSTYVQIKNNSLSLSFPEIFFETWNLFTGTLNPVSSVKLDLTVRQAWVLLRWIETGELKTNKCIRCGAIFPRVAGVEPHCSLCTQFELLHCKKCGKVIQRTSKIYERKSKSSKINPSLCAPCLKKASAVKQATKYILPESRVLR